MVKHDLHRFIDQQRVREAIVRAEAETTAPITVHISPHVEGDVHAAALRSMHRGAAFRRRKPNAVHFFVVPSRREFAVVGDAGAHEALGQAVWNELAATVEKHFRAGDPTAGLIAGIDLAGQHLARHFPRGPAGRS